MGTARGGRELAHAPVFAGASEVSDEPFSYRLRTVRVGVMATFVSVLVLTVFLFLPHNPLHQGFFSILLIATFLGGVVVALLPWRRLFEIGWGDTAMYLWSVLDIILITGFIWTMGLTDSSGLVFYALTTVFFAASYPLKGQIVLMLFTIAAYLTVLQMTSEMVPAGVVLLHVGISRCSLSW